MKVVYSQTVALGLDNHVNSRCNQIDPRTTYLEIGKTWITPLIDHLTMLA